MSRVLIYGALVLGVGFAAASWLGLLRTGSGLAPGDAARAFHVNAVTGPMAGVSLCYR